MSFYFYKHEKRKKFNSYYCFLPVSYLYESKYFLSSTIGLKTSLIFFIPKALIFIKDMYLKMIKKKKKKLGLSKYVFCPHKIMHFSPTKYLRLHKRSSLLQLFKFSNHSHVYYLQYYKKFFYNFFFDIE